MKLEKLLKLFSIKISDADNNNIFVYAYTIHFISSYTQHNTHTHTYSVMKYYISSNM